METTYLVSYFLAAFFWAIVWGFAAKAIATNKGYEYESTKWFWLGFFFSFIAVIIVATKPDNHSRYRSSSSTSYYDSSEDNSSYGTVPYGGWKCKNCGRTHQGYESTCACGVKKDGTPLYKEKSIDATKEKPKESHTVNAGSEAEVIKLIKEYKELLDTGIITSEEFEKKKSQLLWEKTISSDDLIISNEITEGKDSDGTKSYAAEPAEQTAVSLLPSENELFGLCPKCGARQRKNRTICYKCSIPLIAENK